MPDSRRLLVVKKIVELIKTVTMDNGYSVEPKAVYLGRRKFTDEEKMPFVTVVELPEQPEIKTVSSDDLEFHTVALGIFGYVKGDYDEDPTTPAYELLAELQRGLRPGQISRLDKTVIGFKADPGYVWQDDKTGVTYCHLRVAVEFSECLTDPYQAL